MNKITSKNMINIIKEAASREVLEETNINILDKDINTNRLLEIGKDR